MRHSIENNMYVRRIGPQNGIPICYIHGLGESGLCFEKFIQHEKLAAFHHIVPDLPGYGRSVRPHSAMNLTDLADHLFEWMHKIELREVLILGHSMGGVIGQIFAEKHPLIVSAFVNIEGNVSIGDCSFSSPAAKLDLDFFLHDGFEVMIEKIYLKGVESVALKGYYASLRLADPVQFHLNSANLVRESQTENLAGRMAQLLMPKLYIGGIPDGVCSNSIEILQKNEIPMALISKSGHWPFLDQADETATIINHFAKSIRKS